MDEADEPEDDAKKPSRRGYWGWLIREELVYFGMAEIDKSQRAHLIRVKSPTTSK